MASEISIMKKIYLRKKLNNQIIYLKLLIGKQQMFWRFYFWFLDGKNNALIGHYIYENLENEKNYNKDNILLQLEQMMD